MLQYYFSLLWHIKCSFFIHSTRPYIHSRLNSGIEPIFSDCFFFMFGDNKLGISM